MNGLTLFSLKLGARGKPDASTVVELSQSFCIFGCLVGEASRGDRGNFSGLAVTQPDSNCLSGCLLATFAGWGGGTRRCSWIGIDPRKHEGDFPSCFTSGQKEPVMLLQE